VGTELELFSTQHNKVKRDYLARVNSAKYPKHVAASLAKKWGFDYWDGPREVNYGGYHFRPGYWTPLATALIDRYNLTQKSRILEVGCGKGFLLSELKTMLPGVTVSGLDISGYALNLAPENVRGNLVLGSAIMLPWGDKSFDLVISINTLHNLHNFELEPALAELSRVSNKQYLVVESYRNEEEKANLLYWQVTCEQFCTPDEWRWWFRKTNYEGDYEFIYFN